MLLTWLVSIAHFVWKCVLSVLIFLIYGYMEKVFRAGVFVSVLVGLYLMFNTSLWKGLLLLLAHLIAQVYQLRLLIFITFVLLELGFFFSVRREVDDSLVFFRPCEQEIRQLLWKHNRKGLDKVDHLLITKYRGREKELLRKLQAKYTNESFSSPDKALRHDAIYKQEESRVEFAASAFSMQNPLMHQVAQNNKRTEQLRQMNRGGVSDIAYAHVYEVEDDFETDNPMVQEDIPSPPKTQQPSNQSADDEHVSGTMSSMFSTSNSVSGFSTFSQNRSSDGPFSASATTSTAWGSRNYLPARSAPLGTSNLLNSSLRKNRFSQSSRNDLR
jgi:hypothetical protein